jgi:uncharacterized membrane protein affecting hemolysin expression
VDFQLYARVLWRFKLLFLVGLMLAIALATLSLVRVSSDGLTYRQTELYTSATRVLITQKGFPTGRLLAQDPSLDPAQEAARLGIPLADPNRLNNLTILYAELATSDPVLRQMRRDGPILGKIIATPVVVQDGRYTLPLIDIVAIASTPLQAIKLSLRSTTAFQTYLTQQQRVNKVPDTDRVLVETVERPRGAKIFQARSKTMPVVIFLAVMFGIVGLAFLLENLRPRARPGESVALAHDGTARRRTA